MSKEHKCCSNVEEVKAQIMALNGMNTSSTHTIKVVKREVEPDSEGQSITYEEALRRAGEKKEKSKQELINDLLDMGVTPSLFSAYAAIRRDDSGQYRSE